MQKQKIIFTVTNNLEYDQRMHRICGTLSEDFDIELVGRNHLSSKLLPKRYKQTRLNCFFNRGKSFYIEYNIRLFFFLLFSKLDVICAIDLDTIIPCYYISKFRNKKLVYDAHEYFTEVIEVVDRPIIQKIWRRIESYFIPKIKNAYTVSEGLQKLFNEKYHTSFGLIRNISSLKEFVKCDVSEPYLIYVGVVNEGRGIQQLLEAMQHLSINLLICGDGDVFDEMQKKSIKLDVNHKVKFLGNVAPTQLTQLIGNAFAGVLLLENKGLSYYYSLANKFFDYIHGNIPQITINFPEYEVLNQKYNVALLIDLDSNQIINAVNKLLKDKVLYQQLVTNCQVAKYDLCWEKESQKLMYFYQNLS